MKHKLIIMCHGTLAIELKKTVEMIMGPQDNLMGIEFLPTDSLSDLTTRLNKHLTASENYYILCDLKGGTPFNVAYYAKHHQNNITLFSGVNIPLLIELLNQLNILNYEQISDDLKLTQLVELIKE